MKQATHAVRTLHSLEFFTTLSAARRFLARCATDDAPQLLRVVRKSGFVSGPGSYDLVAV